MFPNSRFLQKKEAYKIRLPKYGAAAIRSFFTACFWPNGVLHFLFSKKMKHPVVVYASGVAIF
jgi:hypothetical protein